VENMAKKINVVEEESIFNFGSLETTLGEVPEKPKTQSRGKPGRTARTPETSSGLSADTQALMKRAQKKKADS